MAQINVVEPVREKLAQLIEDVKRKENKTKISKGDMIDELIETYRTIKKL